MQKEYVISLNSGVDYLEFWNEMETNTVEHTYIPDRIVDIVNERPGSQRSCHYALSDEEAARLQNDPRVYSVEIPPDQRTDIAIGQLVIQTSNFSKTISNSSNNINWGLLRSTADTNIYGTGTTPSLSDYNYHLDGTGVDFVVHDGGLQIDHPEFTDSQGVSRFQHIDWYAASGLPGTQNANHDRDFSGHGTHVAGIAAGKTYGWAKNARIYSLKVNGLEGTGDKGNGISVTDCFDVIKLWHINKPVDPVTGKKRPTVVNMSWGYYRVNSDIMTVTGGTYRGTSWVSSDTRYDTPAERLSNFGVNAGWRVSSRIGSVDTDIAELTAAGVIVCVSASNTPYKHDISTGTDYNNYVTSSVGTVYYHQGSSPHGDLVIKVGSIDSTTYNATIERSIYYSTKGPAIDIWAPGTNIMSATSNITDQISTSSYYLNSNFNQALLSGTSMASPQIAGMAMLYLQANPGAGPAEVKDFLSKSAKSTIYSTGLTTDYANTYSLLGSPNRVAYFPYAASQGLKPTNIKVSASFKK